MTDSADLRRNFFNGGIMFKLFVGRDEDGKLKADQPAKFRALRDRHCAD